MCSTLRVPLYHGTSTLFLEDILRLGLGARDPISELGVLNLARAIRPLIHEHLTETDIYRARSDSFDRMADQFSGGRNFQHGQVYLSPCRNTAIRYASSNRYGSELLTNTLDFLQVLVDRDVPTVRDTLYREYKPLFHFLDISPAPVLVVVSDVPVANLADESGGDIQGALSEIDDMIVKFPDDYEEMLQQTNFRLISPLAPGDATVSLVNITTYSPWQREYVLYALDSDKRVVGST